MAYGTTVRLRGHVQAGMFPNERVFIVRDYNDQRFVVIVPDSFVEEREGVATILVRVLDRARGISLVRVPGEALDSNTLSVADSALVPA